MRDVTHGPIHKEYVRRPEGADTLAVIRPRFLNYHRLTVGSSCEYPLHRHSEYELIWVEEGPYLCSVNGKELKLLNRQVIVLKPGDYHQDHLRRGQSHYVLHFDLNEDLFAPAVKPKNQIGAGELRNVLLLFKEIEHESSASPWTDRFSSSIQDALLETLFWQTVRILPVAALSDAFNLYSKRQDFVSRFYTILAGTLSDVFSVEDMAEKMGVSKRTLSLQCSKFLGNSPGKLALNFRMEQAARLLKVGQLSVKEISFCLGFSNPFNFSRAFKRVQGVSPSEYGDQQK